MAGLEEFGGWTEILSSVSHGKDLTTEACTAVMVDALSGSATDAQVAAFLVGLRLKGETVDELVGLQRGMLAVAVPLHAPDDAIDIVGVGGSASRRTHALNVSTMAAFVAAGAGATVCKHGNRKASSTSGSFDLLEALGVPVDQEPATVERQIATHGLGFVFARTFHPSMKQVAGVRAELGIPTVFNILGPLSNPARVRRQVIGVSDWSLARPVAETLVATGSERFMVVHGHGGLDELSTTGASQVLAFVEGRLTESVVEPAELGVACDDPEGLVGGTAETNARIAAAVLSGEAGPVRDIVVLNAASGLVVAGLVDGLADGIALANASLDNGAAQAKLDALRQSAAE